MGAAPAGNLHRGRRNRRVFAVCWGVGVWVLAAAAGAGTCMHSVAIPGHLWEQVSSLQLAKVCVPVHLEHGCSRGAHRQNARVRGTPVCTGNPHWAAAMHTPLTLLGGCCTAHCLPDPPGGGCPAARDSSRSSPGELHKPDFVHCAGSAPADCLSPTCWQPWHIPRTACAAEPSQASGQVLVGGSSYGTAATPPAAPGAA